MTIQDYLRKNKIRFLMSGDEIAIWCPACKKTDAVSHQLTYNIKQSSGDGQCQVCGIKYNFSELVKILDLKPITEELNNDETKAKDGNEQKFRETSEEGRDELKIRNICSAILKDGSIVEMIYDPVESATSFAIYKDGEVSYKPFIIEGGTKLIPYSPDNDLIKKGVILFPSCVEEFGSEAELLKKIQSFIHRYVDINDFFEKVATYYVLFSWAYDRFNELPYFRALGDFGCGKTRFLQTTGYLCNKPVFAGGATTTAPIFRILNDFRGTLILDEADFKLSDATADIIKILNNGFAKGFPVWRCEGKNKYDIKTFDVFGPKILSTRGEFQDKALESRCLTVEMEKGSIRKDIPINVPDSFFEEAMLIRNKLLCWRFLNYERIHIKPELKDETLEPRLNQIIIPLISIIEDKTMIDDLRASTRAYNQRLISDRGMELAGQILEAIIILNKNRPLSEIRMQSIADEFNCGTENPNEKISAKKTGWVVRKQLRLEVEHKRNGYVLLNTNKNKEKLEFLKAKYGLKEVLTEQSDGVNIVNIDNVDNDIPIE